MDLFQEKLKLNIPDADIWYYPHFFPFDKARHYFHTLKQTVPWQQDNITVFGKTFAQPRLTSLFGNNGKTYSYSNITMSPNAFEGELLDIKRKVDKEVGEEFTTCLLNLYRDGKDSNGWHADNEKELGPNPIIASISLGQERYFHLRHKNEKNLKHKILLEQGSLLLMRGETQQNWQHQIPKTSRKIGGRINLTFRIIH